MDKLKALLAACKCGVFLTVNDHRNGYQSVADYLKERRETDDLDREAAIMAKMVETDTVIELQFYNNTPIGSYSIWHYDLELVLDEALKIVESVA